MTRRTPNAARQRTTRQSGHVTLSSDRYGGLPNWLVRAGVGAWLLIGIIIIASLVVFATLQITLVFIAVFLALVFSSVLIPICDWAERFIPRAIAMVVSLILFVTFFVGLLYYVVYSIVNQWWDLSHQFQQGLGEILNLLEGGSLPFVVSRDEILAWFNDVMNEAVTYVQSNAGAVAGQVLSNAGNVAIIFMVLALAMFVTVFMVMRGPILWLWFVNLLPAKRREKTHHAASAAWYTFSGYARGTIIIAIIVGIMAFILLFALGVPLAAPLAVLVFVGTFIPLIGAPLAMIVATLVALATQGWITALIIMIGIALIGQVEGHILQPLVMGKQVSLHPLVVGIGVAAGTILGGLLGAIVVIPLMAVAWAVFATLYSPDPPLEELPKDAKLAH